MPHSYVPHQQLACGMDTQQGVKRAARIPASVLSACPLQSSWGRRTARHLAPPAPHSGTPKMSPSPLQAVWNAPCRRSIWHTDTQSLPNASASMWVPWRQEHIRTRTDTRAAMSVSCACKVRDPDEDLRRAIRWQQRRCKASHLAHAHGDGAHSVLELGFALRLEVAGQAGALGIYSQRRGPYLCKVVNEQMCGDNILPGSVSIPSYSQHSHCGCPAATFHRSVDRQG